MRHILAVLFLAAAIVIAVRAAAEYRPGSGALSAPPGSLPDPGAYVPPVNLPPPRQFPAPAPYMEPTRPYSTAPEGLYPPEGRAAYGSGFDRLDPRGKWPRRE
jgi:hypothetical protein